MTVSTNLSKKYQKYFDLDQIIKDIKQYLPNFDKALFLDAFLFAEKAHEGQFRKDGVTPYLVHPVKTAESLISIHADGNTLISALLHDVPEDTVCDLHEVKEKFGEEVAFLVDGITKLSKVHYQYNMPERQIESLKKLFLHSAKDPRVILIKLADRLHNMETLENIEKPEKRMRISRETLEIYVPIANLLGLRDLKIKLEELCFKNLFPTEYFKLKDKLEGSEKKHKRAFEKLITTISELLKDAKIEPEVGGRHKGSYSIYKKISAQGKTIDDIDDRLGIRIVVDTIPECYQVLGIVHGRFVPKPHRFKDYIANPKGNGYQSLHTTVFGIDGLVTEIQIRTEQMHLEAEYGIAAHFFYKDNYGKNKKSAHLVNDKRSSWVRKILEMERVQKEDSDDFLENLKIDVFQDRIFVFTPRGATIDLPKDASTIDFAYAIHTEIGNHAKTAEINGDIKSVTSTLKTGDVVNVVTSQDIFPELYWLSFAKTNLAKNKIRAHLKKISRKKKTRDGKKMLQKEFDIAGLGVIEDLSQKKIRNDISRHLGKTFRNHDDLFAAIGEGNVRAGNVVKALQILPYQSKLNKNKKSFFSRMFKGNEHEGIVVTLKIVIHDRKGILKEVLDIFYKNSSWIFYIKGWNIMNSNIDHFIIKVTAEDLENISRIFDEIEQLQGVISIERVLYRGAFFLGAVLTLILWGLYPFLPSLLGQFDFFSKNLFIFDLVLYVAFAGLIFTVFTLTKTLKKSFTLMRNKRRIWVASAGILTIAFAALFIELIYFQISLNWIAVFFGVLFMYVYLGVTYLRLQEKD